MNKRTTICMALFFVLAITFIYDARAGNSATSLIRKSEPAIDSNDIGGTVTSGGGMAEAGVWVIAETKEVATNRGKPSIFRKIVVTDKDGQFVVPDLPSATYNVWVRGYGLVDSSPVKVSPGHEINLKVQKASSPQEAARIYPADYWLSLLELPGKDQFPGTGPKPKGNGWGRELVTQNHFVSQLKLGCELCHQLGDAATRLPSAAAFKFGWLKARRMHTQAVNMGYDNLAKVMGDWGRRIADGEVPAQPPRPQGVERDVVLTQWEWGSKYSYVHGTTSTYNQNPRLYPYGKVYGTDLGQDRLLWLNPVTNRAGWIHLPPLRDGYDKPWCDYPKPIDFGSLGCPAKGGISSAPGAYHNPGNPHTTRMDGTGKVWVTTNVTSPKKKPPFCHQRDPSGGYGFTSRSLAYYNTRNKKWVMIDTCFGTHHLTFDSHGNIWTSGFTYTFGFLNPHLIDPNNPEGTEDRAQKWYPDIVDSNGDGVPDTLALGFNYGIAFDPVDGSVWAGTLGQFGQTQYGNKWGGANKGSKPGKAQWRLSIGGFPGRLDRLDPKTRKVEIYSPPLPGFGPRGVAVDSKGNIWTCLSGSSHVAEFDRNKCHQTWGLGNQCPEGWTLWKIPGPNFRNTDIRTDFEYYVFVDRYNTLGLGKDEVVCDGTGSDSLIAFNPKTKKFIRIVSPYPLGFYNRELNGRIDDPNSGWKGRGWWTNYGEDPISHIEDQKAYVMHVQLRPSPLAH